MEVKGKDNFNYYPCCCGYEGSAIYWI